MLKALTSEKIRTDIDVTAFFRLMFDSDHLNVKYFWPEAEYDLALLLLFLPLMSVLCHVTPIYIKQT